MSLSSICSAAYYSAATVGGSNCWLYRPCASDVDYSGYTTAGTGSDSFFAYTTTASACPACSPWWKLQEDKIPTTGGAAPSVCDGVSLTTCCTTATVSEANLALCEADCESDPDCSSVSFDGAICTQYAPCPSGWGSDYAQGFTFAEHKTCGAPPPPPPSTASCSSFTSCSSCAGATAGIKTCEWVSKVFFLL